MAVTLYLFDRHKDVRAVVKGYSELIHGEGKWALSAAIPGHYGAVTGEYLGFRCIDGLFRMFQIDAAEDEDETGRTVIDGTDAAVAELSDMVTVDVRLDSATAQEAFEELLEDTGWTLGDVTADQTKTAKISAYYVETWEALQKAATAYNVRLEAFYTFENGQITGRTLNVLQKEAVFRGRILAGERNASGIRIIKTGSPKTAMYGAGAATGTTEDPDRVTIKDVVWSTANGDPADKPQGQLWVEDAQSVAEKGWRAGAFVNQSITDANELMKATWEALQQEKEPKAVGRATMQDLEPTPGHEHETVRLWDLIAVRNQQGETATAQVTDIDRDYITHWLSKITLGDEEDITSQMASVTKSVEQLGRSGAGGRNKEEENREFIVENMEKIRLHTINIQDNGHRISEAEILLNEHGILLQDIEKGLDETDENLSTAFIRISAAEAAIQLRAEKTAVDEMGQRISAAEVAIDGANAKIALKANQTAVDEMGQRISAAEVAIDGANAKIALKANQTAVDTMGQRISAAEVEIDGANASIALKANKSAVDALGNRIGEAEASIELNADAITTKVSKNGVISSINQTAEEIKIQAAKINLSGYVTASRLSAEIADLEGAWADNFASNNIQAQYGTFTNVQLINKNCSWKSQTVVTGINTTSIKDMYGQSHTVVTSVSTKTINYLSY